MSILCITDGQEESGRAFCITLAREFGVRTKRFKPSNGQERRWAQEGMRPIVQFETVCDMFAESLCK